MDERRYYGYWGSPLFDDAFSLAHLEMEHVLGRALGTVRDGGVEWGAPPALPPSDALTGHPVSGHKRAAACFSDSD